LSSGRPARTQSPSEKTGNEGDSEVTKAQDPTRIQQAVRLGPVSANRRLRNSATLSIADEITTAFPIAERYWAHSQLSGWVRYRSHITRFGGLYWDALNIRPEWETVANKKTWGQCQDSYLASRCCAAIRRRSRCGPVRGWPVLSWHFSPGAAPHVGQATASIFCAVSSFFIAEEEYFKPSERVCTLAHSLKVSG
jgi:hypothetical protein